MTALLCFLLHYCIFYVICFSLLHIFKSVKFLNYTVSAALGISAWLLGSLFDFQALTFTVLAIIFVYTRLKKSDDVIIYKNPYFIFGFLCLFLISYVNLIRFWEYGPPGTNQDTLWNAGHIAYFKNHLNFFNFSDIHVQGVQFKYHFFSQILTGTLVRFTGSYATAGATFYNAIPLLVTFKILYLFLKERFSQLSQLGVLTLSLFAIVSFGLLGIGNPINDSVYNTLGGHYFVYNLGVTLALFFLVLLLIFIVTIAENKKQFTSILDQFLLLIGFILLNAMLLWTKAPYAVVFIGSVSCLLLAAFLKNDLMERKSFYQLIVINIFNTFCFLFIYKFYYASGSVGSSIPSFHFGEIVREALLRIFDTKAIATIWVYVFSPAFILLFFGIGLSIGLFIFYKGYRNKKIHILCFFTLITLFVSTAFMLFFKHRGLSELYFGFAGLTTINFCTCFLLAQKLNDLRNQNPKWLKGLFSVLLITTVSFIFKSKNANILDHDYLQKKACRYLLDRTTKTDVIAINKHNIDDLYESQRNYNRFFSCSANSERQILIEGYDYLPQSEKFKNAITALLEINKSVFEKNLRNDVSYIVDFSQEVTNQQPEIVFQDGDQTISIYKSTK